MRIGLDFDGVIAEQGELRSRGAEELFGIELPADKTTDELAVQGGYLTQEQYDELMEFIYGTPFGLSMAPVEGALLYIPKLLDERHEVSVITARIGKKLETAKEWSRRQGLLLEFTGVGVAKSKANAAQGLDVFADDYLSVLTDLVGVVPNRFLFTWGYNRDVPLGDIARRVGSWKELYEAIQTL